MMPREFALFMAGIIFGRDALTALLAANPHKTGARRIMSEKIEAQEEKCGEGGGGEAVKEKDQYEN